MGSKCGCFIDGVWYDDPLLNQLGDEELTSCTQGILGDGANAESGVSSSDYLLKYRTHDSGSVLGTRKASEQLKGMPAREKLGTLEKTQSNTEE